MTSAPKCVSSRGAHGPTVFHVKSRMRTPLRMPFGSVTNAFTGPPMRRPAHRPARRGDRDRLPGPAACARRDACSPSGCDPERVAHERAARVPNGAADLRVLDVAPEVALLVVRDVVVLLGCAHEPPRDAVRLRAGEDLLSLAGGDQPADPVEHGGSLA